MNNIVKILSGLLASSLLASCGGDVDGFSDQPTSTIGIIASSHFSVGLSEINPEVITDDTAGGTGIYYTGGVTVTVTATAGDRVNALVTNGTVYFRTEYGLLSAPSCTLDSTGTCSITWQSILDFSDLYNFNGAIGSTTNAITAFTQGEESFIDLNGDGAYSDGESFIDTDEPFIDRDDNGTFDAANDIIIDVIDDNIHTPADTLFNGESCNHSTECHLTTQIKTIYATTSMDLLVVK